MKSSPIEIPTLEDDGLFTPEVGDWAEDKYRLMKLYVGLFTVSMRGKWDQLAYIDLFAGAGRSRIRDSGRVVPASPLLALSIERPFSRYVFCEGDAKRMDALKERVRRDFPGVDVRFVPGNVNDNVPEILAELPRAGGGHRVLGFCFVDPFALRDLRFVTIEQLAERYTDFLVLVPSGYDATRNEGIYLESGNRTIDRFLDNPNWRIEWDKARATRQTFDVFITNAFGDSMRRLGYRYEGIDSSHLVRSTEKKLRLYRLVLFSRHPLGERFWNQVRKYASPQRSLFS